MDCGAERLFQSYVTKEWIPQPFVLKFRMYSLLDKVRDTAIGYFQKCQCHLMLIKLENETIHGHEKRVKRAFVLVLTMSNKFRL